MGMLWNKRVASLKFWIKIKNTVVAALAKLRIIFLKTTLCFCSFLRDLIKQEAPTLWIESVQKQSYPEMEIQDAT